MQRYLTTARSPLSLRILSMRRSPRRSATTNVATRDWDQHSARMPRTIEMFEAVGYFVGCAATDWDEATRSGHAGGSSPPLAGDGALGGATVAARNRISAHASARCAVARKSSIRVGRIDVLAAPTARR